MSTFDGQVRHSWSSSNHFNALMGQLGLKMILGEFDLALRQSWLAVLGCCEDKLTAIKTGLKF